MQHYKKDIQVLIVMVIIVIDRCRLILMRGIGTVDIAYLLFSLFN